MLDKVLINKRLKFIEKFNIKLYILVGEKLFFLLMGYFVLYFLWSEYYEFV